MEKMNFSVAENEGGKRLDLLLADRKPLYSRSYWQKMCREGYVTVNGKVQIKPAFPVREKDEIETVLPSPEKMVAEAEEIPLSILYEDRDLLVVNKPKGMVVHPAAGHRRGTLVNALLAHCHELPSVDKLRPGIVHRLDKDTSGLLVVAKNEPSFFSLTQQLKERNMKREYRAIAHGRPGSAKGTIDLPLGRDRQDRKKFAVRLDGGGRRAVTHYRLLVQAGAFSLLGLELETGRTHQIRVHLAAVACPVVGDPLYGPQRSPYKKMGQLLHARSLGFIHPVSRNYLEFTAEPGEEFAQFLNQEGRQ